MPNAQKPFPLLRCAALAAVGLMLSGCAAMPPSLKMASWAIDGISYLTTEKSVMDHGLSVASGKDCAVMRLVTEKSACRTPTPGVDFNANLSPQADKGFAAIAAMCDTDKIARTLPDNREMNRCAQRLVEKFGRIEAIAQCDRHVEHLIARGQTDDAAIWVGVQVAAQTAPAVVATAETPSRVKSRGTD